MKTTGKRIVLGVTGSIAAYKAVYLLRLITAADYDVRVIMTPTARRFVGELTFEALSGHPVFFDQFANESGSVFAHIDLAGADLIVVAPATADTIGKMAAGIADNLLLDTYLAARCPVIICPAMNSGMWRHPAVQENLKTLNQRGAKIIKPATGKLACGDEGEGRMRNPEAILKDINSIFEKSTADLSGKSFLITAGATREPIDSVRFISNRSSGKMGFALAKAARDRGASVTVIAANCVIDRDLGIKYVQVNTTGEMEQAVNKEFKTHDVLIMAAAVSDYKVSSGETMGKIERKEINSLQLLPTSDIVSNLRDYGNSKVKVGFAAEFGKDKLYRARQKLKEKNLDMIVFNDISRNDIGFDSDDNEIVIMGTGQVDLLVDKSSKMNCANRILDRIKELF